MLMFLATFPLALFLPMVVVVTLWLWVFFACTLPLRFSLRVEHSCDDHCVPSCKGFLILCGLDSMASVCVHNIAWLFAVPFSVVQQLEERRERHRTLGYRLPGAGAGTGAGAGGTAPSDGRERLEKDPDWEGPLDLSLAACAVDSAVGLLGLAVVVPGVVLLAACKTGPCMIGTYALYAREVWGFFLNGKVWACVALPFIAAPVALIPAFSALCLAAVLLAAVPVALSSVLFMHGTVEVYDDDEEEEEKGDGGAVAQRPNEAALGMGVAKQRKRKMRLRPLRERLGRAVRFMFAVLRQGDAFSTDCVLYCFGCMENPPEPGKYIARVRRDVGMMGLSAAEQKKQNEAL
jgi:hypothetical protein